MKTKILLLFILIMPFSLSFAQTNKYHPFPDSAIWRVDYYYNSAPPSYDDTCYCYFYYYITGDTLINSYVHKKINRSYIAALNPPCDIIGGGVSSDSSGYVGALRDDSLDNKTFFVFPNKNTDSLLFDYNLNAGDTVKGGILMGFPYPDYMIVLSVDSVLINGQYRKRWNFGTCQTRYFGGMYHFLYIIEGIGSSCGIFEPLCTWTVDFTTRYLVCVKDSSGTLFSTGYNSAMGCNLIHEGLNEINNKEGSINIYPNPTTDDLTIEAPQQATIEITNIEGQVIKQQTTNVETTNLNVSALAKGMYFVKIKTERGVEVKKIVKE